MTGALTSHARAQRAIVRRRARAAQDADARSTVGYRQHTRARSTGTLVILVDGYEQGLATPGEPGGDGRRALICDPHGGIVTGETQAELLPLLSHPEDWCPYCQRERGDETGWPESSSE